MMSASSRSGIRFVSRCHYLTARCPTGCESWLHPRAVDAHIRLGGCSGEPWVDNVEDSVLVPEPTAALFSERLPATLVGPVNVSDDRVLRRRSAEGVRDDVLHGIVVRSPIAGVGARRWMYVIRAAAERDGPQVIERGMTPGGFRALEQELQVEDWLVDCPDCGEPVKRSRINLHRARSTLCRWRRGRSEVGELWEAGWRDPFSVSGAPQSWGALRAKAVWHHRIHTVEFPRWVAVLLAPTVAGSPCDKDEMEPGSRVFFPGIKQ